MERDNPSTHVDGRDPGTAPGHVADRIGAVASALCAVHCALTALAPALLVALGLGMWMSHELELGLTVVAVLFGLASLRMAWRAHKSPAVLAVLVLGIGGLVGARAQEMAGGHHDHHGAHGEHGEHGEHEGDAHEGDAHEGDGHGEHEAHGEHGEHEAHGDHGKHDGEHEVHGEHEAHGEHNGEHSEHGHHDESGSPLGGEALGILAGLVLCIGHIFNLRVTRRRYEAGRDAKDVVAS